MGLLAEHVGTFATKARGKLPGLREGRRLWQEVFGDTAVDKERDLSTFPPVRGGSYGRTMIASPESYKRLLEAMRSMAPGGWSDDRWEESRHFNGIQYCCIHRMGEQLAQAEFQVFRKDKRNPEGKVPAESKGADQIIHLLEKPNREDTFGDLIYRWNQQMGLTGTALTWMVPNALPSWNPNPLLAAGTPYELYSVPTAIAIPQPAINPAYPDGYYRIQPLYPYGPFSSYPTPATAVGAPIPAQWILRFKFPHPLLRYDGYAPLTALRLHVDEVESIDRSRWYKMKRAFNPDVVLNMTDVEGSQPFNESEIERIRSEFENTHQGPENHGRVFVGTPGGKLEQFGVVPKDMDYQAGWEQLVSFVMAGYGITKPAAGMIEDASYASLFATLKQLHLLTLKPLCDRYAAQLTRHLAPFFGDDLIIEIRCPRIDDHDVKRANVETLIGAKAITKNETRREFDMPETDEPWGKEIAGDPSPLEQQNQAQEVQREQEAAAMEQQTQGAANGVVPPGAGGPPPPVPLAGATAPGVLPEGSDVTEPMPPEVTREQPTPGPLGRGALGPRGIPRKGKSLYDYLRKGVMLNGTH